MSRTPIDAEALRQSQSLPAGVVTDDGDLPEPVYLVATLQSDGDCTVNVTEVAAEDYFTAEQMHAVRRQAFHDGQCKALQADAREKGEAVAWQRGTTLKSWRGPCWQECTREEHDAINATGVWTDETGFNWPSQARALYATHPAQASEAVDGVSLIAAERNRQVASEGFSMERDDCYLDDELGRAAACYALPEKARPYDYNRGYQRPSWWPASWIIEWWKPTPSNRIRELAKAGALIAAEIDRLQRAALATSSQETASE